MTLHTDCGYSYLDTLVLQNTSFAIYRMPGNKETAFALQQKENPESLLQLTDLNGKSGFVVSPFRVSEQTPIVLLHPDVNLEGEDSILDFLERRFQKIDPLTGKSNLGTTASERPDSKGSSFFTNPYCAYKKAFELFQDALRSNTCEKIVLSRTLKKRMPVGFSVGRTFKAACEAYPEAFVYLCHTPQTGTWFGSSPELLLSGENSSWHTAALAGTMKAPVEGTSVEWNNKNIREQHIVSDYLEKQLSLHHLTGKKKGPYTSKAGKLMHLKTDFDFKMTQKGRIGDLLESLHPTPAVCGFPKEKAHQLLLDHEGYDRKYYSGFIGELSLNERTNLFVNLRCMQVQSNTLTFFAGGGLLASSELDAEWEETEEKLQTMLSLIDFDKK